jgi:hypothetical protein
MMKRRELSMQLTYIFVAFTLFSIHSIHATEESQNQENLKEWDRYAEIMYQNEKELFEKQLSEAYLYRVLQQECEKLRSTLQENKNRIFEAFKIDQYKAYDAQGNQLRTLVNASILDNIINEMKNIINSSQDKIELVQTEIDHVEKYRNELKIVYQAIIKEEAIRSQDLEKGISKLEESFNAAIQARKDFLSSVFGLLDETNKTIETLQKEVLTNASI